MATVQLDEHGIKKFIEHLRNDCCIDAITMLHVEVIMDYLCRKWPAPNIFVNFVKKING